MVERTVTGCKQYEEREAEDESRRSQTGEDYLWSILWRRFACKIHLSNCGAIVNSWSELEKVTNGVEK